MKILYKIIIVMVIVSILAFLGYMIRPGLLKGDFEDSAAFTDLKENAVLPTDLSVPENVPKSDLKTNEEVTLVNSSPEQSNK